MIKIRESVPLMAIFMAMLLQFTAGIAIAQQPGAPFPPPPPAAVPGVVPGAVPEQEQVLTAPGQVIGEFRKIQFAVFDMYSFRVHPFFQMTGMSSFTKSHASTGGTTQVGTPKSEQNSEFLEKAFHSLPSFGLEYGWGTEVTFPRSIGIGLDYSHVYEKDSDAITDQPVYADGTVPPRFDMDTYYYALAARFYGLDASVKGINYFIGFSLGRLEGNLRIISWDPAVSDQIIYFSQAPVGATRMGIDFSKEEFGGRFEMILINAREVKMKENPFLDRAAYTIIDFSGSILRISAYYRFL